MVKRRNAKTERKISKAQEKGRIKAQIEEEAKTFKNKKHFIVWIKKLVEKHAALIPKGVAVLGITFIIHNILKKPEFQALLPPILRWRELEYIKGWEWLGLYRPSEQEPIEITEEIWTWIIAFSLAYIIIEHGGQIALGLGEGVKGLTGIVGFLLG